MTEPGVVDAAALAGEAWRTVLSRPREAQGLALDALAATDDPAVRSLAHRSLGIAALEVGDVETSVAENERAVAEAERADDDALSAEAEMGLALALQHRGDARAAIHHADRAVAAGPAHPRIAHQRALILERVGRVEEAIEAYRAAEELAVQQNDHETLPLLWCSRGVLWIYRAKFDEAARDLLAAEAFCAREGLEHLGTLVRANLGYLAARRGDLVEALDRLEEVTPVMAASGGLRQGVHELDRCEVLLLAGLPRDAVVAGQIAIRALSGSGMGIELAEAKVVTAQASLQNGDPSTAEALARDALRALRRHRHASWEALAREVVVRAEWSAGRRDAGLMRRARAVAGDLEVAGWSSAAASARIVSARLSLELGHPVRARNELRLVNATAGAPVALRIQARHAEALLLLAEGDVRGAKAKLRDGWQILEQHRATLGATELRVGAATHAIEIAQLGLRLAATDRDPAEVFDWAERVRAGALHQPAARAPRDGPLAAALAELRVVAAEADAAAKGGGDPRRALRRQAELEETVRRRAQIVPVSEGGAPSSVDMAGLAPALGQHVVVEYVEIDGKLAAIVASDRGATLRWLGLAADAEREIVALRMALRRMAFGSPVAALGAAARAGAAYSASALAAQLLAPLAEHTSGRPVVVVPTGSLHSLPWSALEGPHASLVVAPSATLWLRGHEGSIAAAAAGSAEPGGVLLVAGPRLAEARAEIFDIAAHYPGATVLHPADATIAAAREGLANAELAHLACHGIFRDDNPLFSSLELADGALSVFEFEDLPTVPRRIVLSACDAGLSSVHPGDELLGVTAALLRLGTRSLVASTLPVPDGASRRLMTALHRALADGHGVADALALARASADPSRDDDVVAAAAFTVFGSG